MKFCARVKVLGDWRTLAAALLLLPIGAVMAQSDGIAVSKPSIFSRIGSASGLERQAALQYQQTLQNAQQKHALGADNHPQVIRLRQIAARLIPYTQRWNPKAASWQWEINLLGSREVNAYCMPGGKIAFYSGILESLKLTDDEVAIVMGHEIAHALREHGAERQGKANLANFGVRMAEVIAGAKGYDPNIAGSIASGVANVGMLAFSRADESEADLVGLDLAARAGYDPRAGIALWQKMGLLNQKSPPQWLSTHPSGANRIEEIRKHLPEVMPLYAKAVQRSPATLPPYRSNLPQLAAIPWP